MGNKTEQLLAIIAAGREIHLAIDTLDTLVSAQLGIHRSDLRCLFRLKDGPATAGEIAQSTGLTSGSVTALLDRLEATGFIERRRSLTDRRSVLICLPDCRRAQLDAIGESIEAAVRDHFAAKDAGELASTVHALAEFAAALAGAAPAPDRQPGRNTD